MVTFALSDVSDTVYCVEEVPPVGDTDRFGVTASMVYTCLVICSRLPIGSIEKYCSVVVALMAIGAVYFNDGDTVGGEPSVV